MSDGCEIYIEGSGSSTYDGTYYIGCNSVQYIRSDGVNTSSSSITAYQSISTDGTRGARVVFPSYSNPYYQPSSGYNTYYFTVEKVTFNGIANFYRELNYIQAGFYFLVSVAVVLRLFRRS